VIVCPQCGQENEPGSETCRACGKSLTTPAEPALSPVISEQMQIADVKVGDYFKAGWEIFKKYPAGFIGYFVIIMAISYVLQFVPVIGRLAAFALAVPLNAGFFVVSAKLLKNQSPEFIDFFSGFQFLLQLVLLGVVSSTLIIIGFILLIVPGFYLMVSYTFALMLVVDQRLDFWPAMEKSRRSVQTSWFKIFALLLLLVLLNLGGVLFLLVGLLVSVPLTHCILTAAYADIFGITSAHTISMHR
jgi:uncharacterized membrane protein